MRVISGIAKGTRLKMVPSKHVRPTADRVKESLFNVIGPFFHGGHILDLFAGTGALGIEALSRGSDSAVFVDSSRKSVKTLKENLQLTKFDSSASILCEDAHVALKKLHEKGLSFDLIFLDPPYSINPLPFMERISKYSLVTDNGMVVLEHGQNTEMQSDDLALTCFRKLAYGSTFISLFVHKEL